MITLNDFLQQERALLLDLLRSIDADALAAVFDPGDAAIADNARAKMIKLIEDAE